MVVVFDLPDPALYDLVAAGKAHVAEPIVYPAGTIVAIFFDPGFDIVLVRIELTGSGLSMYFLTVLRLMPSLRAMARCFSPLRCNVKMSNMVSFFSSESSPLFIRIKLTI
jgi:hypothetical protein